MEGLKTAVEEYLQNGDSQLLLVEVSKNIDAGQSEDVSSLFLQPRHKNVVKAIGWDLLSLLTPHLSPNLPPSPTSHIWQLITFISEICSAKEMCLAFLEQLEAVSPSPSLFFHLLTPLLTVLLRLGVGDERRHVSPLRSVRAMLTRVYPTLEEEEQEEEENKFSSLTAAGLVVALVEPFAAHIHHQFTSGLAPLQTFWSPLQRECVGLLLTLLDQPLVSHDLTRRSSESRTTAQTIMREVVRCHCGCLQLLECGEQPELRAVVEESEVEDSSPFDIPLVGVACFVYLVMVEGVESGYLPSPLHPHHLLHTSLSHTLTLLHRQERRSILKGLKLLENVVDRVETDTLPKHLLTHNRYLNTAKGLVDIMITSPHKTLRQKSLALLPSLVQRFTSFGRYRLYRSLLKGCGHTGVQGMLIHCLKNEVDQALLSADVSSPFLSPELIPLLQEVLTFSCDSELLRETDRVMGGLNFLRYLLIRDRPEVNKTGVWSLVGEVRSKFVEPVRQALESNKVHLRGERERQKQGGKGKGEVPEVVVEVAGEEVPEISPDEQARMLQLAEHQLDMMECVLVRVEELLEHKS